MDDDSVHLEMQADCLLILSCLCEMNSHRKVDYGTYYYSVKMSLFYRNCLEGMMEFRY